MHIVVCSKPIYHSYSKCRIAGRKKTMPPLCKKKKEIGKLRKLLKSVWGIGQMREDLQGRAVFPREPIRMNTWVTRELAEFPTRISPFHGHHSIQLKFFQPAASWTISEGEEGRGGGKTVLRRKKGKWEFNSKFR